MNPLVSLRDFHAHALAIERDAVARYRALATQMSTHNNHHAAIVFEQLANAEAEHAERLSRAQPDVDVVHSRPWDYRWASAESPESVPFETVHYLMEARGAFELALAAEERARAFFEAAAADTPNPEVRTLAREFAQEERAHIALIETEIERLLPSSVGPTHDLDPPREVD